MFRRYKKGFFMRIGFCRFPIYRIIREDVIREVKTVKVYPFLRRIE